VPVVAVITIKALTGFTDAIGDAIKQSIVDYVNALPIGQRIDLGRLYLPAQFFGGLGSETFEVNDISLGIIPADPTAADVDVDFNQVVSIGLADITLSIEP
jgi:hypothetical protein